MEDRVIVELDAREWLELQRIVVDREAEEALRFLELLKTKVDRAQQGH